jgi:hypothetical protein
MVEQVVDVDLRRDLELLPFADGAEIPAETQVETEEAGEADLAAIYPSAPAPFAGPCGCSRDLERTRQRNGLTETAQIGVRRGTESKEVYRPVKRMLQRIFSMGNKKKSASAEGRNPAGVGPRSPWK